MTMFMVAMVAAVLAVVFYKSDKDFPPEHHVAG